MKDLTYYKSLDYEVITLQCTFEGVKYFHCFCEELGRFSCYGQGDTEQEALDMFREEKDFFIEWLYNSGRQIPEPEKLHHGKNTGFAD